MFMSNSTTPSSFTNQSRGGLVGGGASVRMPIRNINLIAFGAMANEANPGAAVVGQVFALFVITIAAAEVGVGLAIVLLIYRNRTSVDLDEVDMMKG